MPMKILISLLILILTFSSCHQAPSPKSEFQWKPYSEQAVADSVAHNRPIVIDFFADWCPVCHELDRTVFSRPEIQSQLAKVTPLRMDATNQDDPKVQEILQKYEIEGLPTIVFLDSHGHEVNNARVIGLVTPEEFSQAFAMLNIFKQ